MRGKTTVSSRCVGATRHGSADVGPRGEHVRVPSCFVRGRTILKGERKWHVLWEPGVV